MADEKNVQTEQTTQTTQTTQDTQNVAIDYDKIQKMLDGTLRAKEETALKAYFKQQGLTQEQVAEAIVDFKSKQAASAPDVDGLTAQITQAQAQVADTQAKLRKADVQIAAYGMADELGISIQTMGYVLKLADLKGTVDDKGVVKADVLKTALEKVLTDLPQLKPSTDSQAGFRPAVGAHGSAQNGQAEQPKAKGVPTKRWNRFNGI